MTSWANLTTEYMNLGLPPPQGYAYNLTLLSSLNKTPSNYGTLPKDKVTATPELRQTFYDNNDVTKNYASYNNNVANAYASDNRELIKQHIDRWTSLGVDIIVPDLTNNMYELFSYASKMDQNHPNYQRNVEVRALAEICKALKDKGSAIKIIPVFGAQNALDISTKDSAGVETPDHLTPLQRAVDYMNSVFDTQYNGAPLRTCSVVYDNYTLMVAYGFGSAGLDVTNATSRQNIANSLAGKSITLRFMTGLIDDQTSLWAEGTSPTNRVRPPNVRATDTIWTWHDRMWSRDTSHTREAGGSYTCVPGNVNKVEFISAPPTSAAIFIDGTGDYYNVYNELTLAAMGTRLTKTDTPYLPFQNGGVLYNRLSLARSAHPIFLFLPEFNHFHAWDCGYTQATAPDLEPTIEWGWASFNIAQQAIQSYKQYENGGGIGRFSDIRFRGVDHLSGGIIVDGSAMTRILAVATGPSLVGIPSGSLMTNPAITMYQGATVLAQNDTWNMESTGLSVPTTGNRVMPNSSSRIQFVNKSVPLSEPTGTKVPLNAAEAAVTADITPGAYTFYLPSNGSANKIGHIFMETSDCVSNTRIKDFSCISKVDSTNPYGQIIAQFHIDKAMNIAIRGAGASLVARACPKFPVLKERFEN
jgi:hypothetical protein